VAHGRMEGKPVEQLFREQLQRATLTALSRERLFQTIVLQGGTALRLFYRNPRFSEDLDFVLKRGSPRIDLNDHALPVKGFVQDSFPFLDGVKLELQKDSKELQRLVLRAISDSLPRASRLHLELAYVPSYLNEPRILDFPPFNPAIRVEEETEILADKVTALLCRSYIKGRDLWDIHYLSREKDVELSMDLVARKLEDHGVRRDDWAALPEDAARKIGERGLEALEGELERFLTKQYSQLYRDQYENIVAEVTDIVQLLEFSHLGMGLDEDQ